jgi:hypothetical protein
MKTHKVRLKIAQNLLEGFHYVDWSLFWIFSFDFFLFVVDLSELKGERWERGFGWD